MQIFNESDIARIKARMSKNPAYLEKIEADTRDIRAKLYIQKTGLATWSHYFTCPVCGIKLTFDYYNNAEFHCQNCKSVQTGEPYLGAWWEAILGINTYGAYKLALGYVGAGREDMLAVAKEILLGYADNYKNYEVHGGIPYNNPGRFASQVLSDSHPIYHLALTYALLKEQFTEEERRHIENDLFREASKHQIKYLTPQIHNHEVAICTSIAVIGLAIDDSSLVDYALNTKYCLKYQIDNAYLDDNYWFECSTGYHHYSLYWFMCYEMAARNTEYSLFSDEKYRDKLYSAMLFPLNIYIGNNSTASFNDGNGYLNGHGSIYEYAYEYFKTEELARLLRASYVESLREDSLLALVFGADEIPEARELEKKNYISKVGSQLAVLHGTEDRYFILKAMPYGGEHDHYDRLGISFDAFGDNISPDLGTADGYGSPLHYGYYKNTASHNTVVINGENMAPCDTKVNEYRVNAPDDIYLDAETLPPEDYKMLDSFTIKQWSDEAYRGVRMRRVVSWHDKYFIDIFVLKSENDLKKEYTLRINGQNIAPKYGRYVNGISNEGAQKYIKNAYLANEEGIVTCVYKTKSGYVDVHALADNLTLVYADGPGKPANEKVSYLLEERTKDLPSS